MVNPYFIANRLYIAIRWYCTSIIHTNRFFYLDEKIFKKSYLSLDKHFLLCIICCIVNPILEKYFTAKDIQSLLGINKDKLYHWVERKGFIKPAIERGLGRGSQSKYSFKNLLQLLLFKELYELKFDFNQIEHILKIKTKLFDPISGSSKLVDIWDNFSSNRKELEESGYILVIQIRAKKIKVIAANEKIFYQKLSQSSLKDDGWVLDKPRITIDLLEKIILLEKKTGKKI